MDSKDNTINSIKKAVVDENLLAMLPKEKFEAIAPKNVLAKVMIEGRADKLLDIVKQIMGTYIEKDSYGNVRSQGTKNLVLTLMVEEK